MTQLELMLVTAPPKKKDPAAVSLGRRGGRATSVAKAAAARTNGAKGGRPRLKKGAR